MSEEAETCSAGPSGNHHVSEQTFLDLLTSQQTRGQDGIRLVFHNTLAKAVSLDKDPYLFCALTGNAALAVFLYQNQVAKGSPIRIATFTSEGTRGVTPWKKALKVTAPIAARLAGNSSVAEALDNIERGTPLHWSPDNANQWPDTLKAKIRPSVEALSKSPWYLSLPGSVRVRIMQKFVSQAAAQTFWSRLPPSAMQENWAEAIEPGLLHAAHKVVQFPASNTGSGTKQRSAAEEDQQFPSYQIRITGERVAPSLSRGRVLLGHLTRGAAGWLAIKALRHVGITRLIPEGVAVFALGCFFPAPTLMLAACVIKT